MFRVQGLGTQITLHETPSARNREDITIDLVIALALVSIYTYPGSNKAPKYNNLSISFPFCFPIISVFFPIILSMVFPCSFPVLHDSTLCCQLFN